MGEIINKYITKRNRLGTDFLFLNSEGKELSRYAVNELLKLYLSLADLPPINIHAFRHTFATLMANEDTPINIIQQLLGHRDIRSTKGYINPHYVRNKNLRLPENELILNRLREKLKTKNK